MTSEAIDHMDRHIWARIATVPVAVLLASTTASCGGESSTQSQGKRLASQGPCDLIKFDDLKRKFDPPDQVPAKVGSLCFYSFKNAVVKIELASEVDHNGAPIEIDGVTATKTPFEGVCYIDVWLVPGDQSQHFTVHFFRREPGASVPPGPDCDTGIMVARMVLNSLPEGK